MPHQRSLAEILGAHADSIRKSIRKCLPATVTAVNPGAQTVDVQVAVNSLLHDEYGSAFSEPAPSITGVPLGVMRGGGFLVWVPVDVGDSVLLVFSDYSTDTWRAGDGTPQDPGFHGVHSPDSPFAIPMFAPDAKKLSSPASGKVVIGKDGADQRIEIDGTAISLGAGATDFVALASKVATELSKIQATLLTGTTSAGPVTFGTPYTAGAVAATLVKAK